MNKALKTILIISVITLGLGFLAVPSARATVVDELVVEYWSETESRWLSITGPNGLPIFGETNFLPSDSVSRLVKVTNNSGETKKIGLNIIDNSGCSTNCLSDVLDLVVSKNGTTMYSGSLTSFYEAGEKPLSDLGAGSAMTYQFSITFRPLAGNKYQNSSANFNIKIGFFGEESISPEISPGGGGGAVFIAGLEIYDEAASGISENSVTITWRTNLDSTSRVIYSPYGFPHLLNLNEPPNYGYVFSTIEDSAKVIGHTVVITGLLPTTTYYFRCISHTSPGETITIEHTFTTKGVAGAAEEIVPLLPEAPPLGKEEGIEPEVEGEFIEEDKEGIVEEITIGEDKDLDKFLAAADAFLAAGNLCWLFFVVIIILTVLYLLSRNKKEKEIKKKDLIFLLIIILLIILYCIFCCSYCWILILVISLLFILFTVLILRRKIREREN